MSADRLSKEIRVHQRLYDLGSPLISDTQFDSLFIIYKQRLGDSTKIADDPSKILRPPTEAQPLPQKMLSLRNCFDGSDLESFLTRSRDSMYILEPKFDGVALGIQYIDGIVTSIYLRGDGINGRDVTKYLTYIEDIPNSLNITNGEVFITGEVVIPKHLKDKLEVKSLRNYAAGAFNLKEPSKLKERSLHFVAFGVKTSIPIISEEGRLEFLRKLGFATTPYRITNYGDIRKRFTFHYDKYIQERLNDYSAQIDYEIDGLVLKAYHLTRQDQLGDDGHSPKWATALKLRGEGEDAIIEEVSWQVGRTGVLTPVADLTPTNINGVTISRATLHNIETFKKLQVSIGSVVKIERAGEVIPHIIERKEEEPPRAHPTPKRCPSCGRDTYIDGAYLFCPNLLCRERVISTITYAVSKSCLDIKGIGQGLIRDMVKNELFDSFHDLFHLKERSLIETLGISASRAETIVTSIRKKRDAEAYKFLMAMSIPYINEKTCRYLCSMTKDFYRFLESFEGTVSVLKLNEPQKRALNSFIKNPDAWHTFNRLHDAGVIPINSLLPTGFGFLSNVSFAITGSLSGYVEWGRERDESQRG
jgi:DNA ligase (NAD+)